MTDLESCQILDEEEYYEALENYGEEFSAGMGAEAVKTLLMEMDLEEEIALIEQQMTETKSEAKIKKLSKNEQNLSNNENILDVSDSKVMHPEKIFQISNDK